jgi:hypothetical protein
VVATLLEEDVLVEESGLDKGGLLDSFVAIDMIILLDQLEG